ncbi:AAA family ATPase [Coraliomargarita parva]|uniref:AAA family ATPase n=1 Tax=Coraliomargarita parva TaxID=3014050 RepID=UPI0022B443E5|nr:AAA family ATPase [Coraliomargarita parva]
MKEEDFSQLHRVWLLRMLTVNRALYRFIENDRLADEDIARAIGLEHWLAEPWNLIPKRQCFSLPGGVKSIQYSYELEQIMRPQTDPAKFHRIEVMKEVLATITAEAGRPVRGPEQYIRNCELVARLYGLSPVERDLLAFLAHTADSGLVNDMFHVAKARDRPEYLRLVAVAIQAEQTDVERATAPKSRLIQTGLLKWSTGRSCVELEVFNSEFARKLLYQSCEADTIIRDVVTPAPPGSLRYRDYPHLKEVLGQMRPHLRRALREKRSGVNCYLYGKPGTGKSELVRILAREMRAALFEVATEDESGQPARYGSRMDALVKANALLAKRRALLVFDEAEDVFRSTFLNQSLASQHKGWMNRRLETNPVPTIWVSNSIKGLEPAFARRFDFVVEIAPPPRDHRIRMYQRLAGGKASPQTLQTLARCDDLTPAVVARAARVATGLAGSSPEARFDPVFRALVERTLKAQQHDTRMFRNPSPELPQTYKLDYLNCDSSLDHLAEGLRSTPSCRLCLYGPPGTGKTSLGHWLSRELGQPLLLKKASDLLSPYLGETEQKMARAFEEAGKDTAILMIDEVDSFLQDRGQAQRSWEVQQVNELLTQMERFDGIFIASTNLMDALDPAALRRFDLKLRFGYLNGDQLQGLLSGSCRELKLPPPRQADLAAIAALSNATPGDFANCRRQARFRNFRSAAELVEAVAQECRIKADRGARKLGFSDQ